MKVKRERDVCRTCLGTINLRPLPRTRAANKHHVDLIQEITGVKIHQHDGLPQVICTKCRNAITALIAFRDQCRNAERILLDKYRDRKKIISKKINFNNKEELHILVNIKEDDIRIIKKEDLKIKLENLSHEIEISHDVNDYDTNDTVLICLKDELIEVSAITKEDEFIESLLTELGKHELENLRIENIDLSIKNEIPKETVDVDFMDNLDDLTDFDSNLDESYSKSYDYTLLTDEDNAKYETVNTETRNMNALTDNIYSKDIKFDGSTLKANVEVEQNEEVAVETEQNNEVLVEPEKSRVYTRLDLIEGTPNKFGPNKCRLCKNVSPNLKSFYKHLNSKHFGNKKSILCEFCAMRFADNQKLLRHCRAKHGLARDNSFPCAYCTYQALDKEQLEVHERRVHTKERPFVCDNCGAGFYSKRVLIQHSRNHTEDKPYQCDKCPSKFKTRQRLCGHNLKIHVRRFTYACHVCDKRLSKSPYIRRHLLREHGITLDKQGRLRKVYLDHC